MLSSPNDRRYWDFRSELLMPAAIYKDFPKISMGHRPFGDSG